jgi:hypothetical protein
MVEGTGPSLTDKNVPVQVHQPPPMQSILGCNNQQAIDLQYVPGVPEFRSPIPSYSNKSIVGREGGEYKTS